VLLEASSHSVRTKHFGQISSSEWLLKTGLQTKVYVLGVVTREIFLRLCLVQPDFSCGSHNNTPSAAYCTVMTTATQCQALQHKSLHCHWHEVTCDKSTDLIKAVHHIRKYDYLAGNPKVELTYSRPSISRVGGDSFSTRVISEIKIYLVFNPCYYAYGSYALTKVYMKFKIHFRLWSSS
jgi:hypothetical protein